MAHAGAVKVLIIAPAWVGDMVMAHTLVQSLIAHHPQAEIHMAAPPATAPLGQRMPGVARVHLLELAHGELGLGKRRAAGRRLAAERFNQAIVLPNSLKSALIPWFAKIPKRTGWHGEARYLLLNDRRRLDPAAYPLMIERFMALADPAGRLPAQPYPLPELSVDRANRDALLERFGLHGQDVVAMCPGAEFGPAKKWPAGHYAELARGQLAQGRQVWLLGSPKDVEDCQAIAQAAPGVVNLAGRTSLLDALDLLSCADFAVCNDSGLMHVAGALGRPTIGIFGSTSPGFTPPLGPRAVVVQRDLDCRPCFARECPLGHLDCLAGLPAAEVERHLQAGPAV